MGFLPKPKNFSDRFEALARKIREIAGLLDELKSKSVSIPDVAKKAKVIENGADAIVHEIVNELMCDHIRTFEDKQDVRRLAHQMDNIVDFIEAATSRLDIYSEFVLLDVVHKFTPILKDSAEQIEMAILCLKKINNNSEVIKECCVKIHTLENEADELSKKWLARIMNDKKLNFRKVMVANQVIKRLERATDQCEHVANILEGIRIKGDL